MHIMLVKRNTSKKLLICTLVGLFSFSLFINVAYTSYSYFDANYYINRQKQLKIISDSAIKIAVAREAKKKEPVYINLPGTSQIRAIVDDYSLTASIWAIVSKTHPISVDYIPQLLKIPGVATRTDKSDDERSVRSDIEIPLKNMFAAALAEGNSLMIGSGYRSANLQTIYFNNLAGSIGEETANQSIARPGQSEHQTGLAVDISTVSYECYLNNCFADTGDGQWLVNNSYKFGFILRYPESKESITGYRYEPWHFRYVGIDLATALHESGLTLDEAWPYLEQANVTLRTNGAI